MGKQLVFTGPFKVEYESYPDVPLEEHEVRIQTLYSGISAGTEMTQYRGTNPYLLKHWNVDKRLFVAGKGSSLSYPIQTIGYEEVGKIVETGTAVSDIPVGAFVFGTWGHRTHFVAGVDYVQPRLLPDGFEPLLGIYSHIGAVAINGIHDSEVRIGETVAIFGLGVLGQIVAQAARQSGARVIAVDLLDSRLKLAKELGAHIAINARREDVAETIKDLTDGRGADVCFEVTGSTAALHEAIRAVAYSARVVAMGFFQGEGKNLYLGEEFHHNRINLVCSQISGVNPHLTYRWDKMRLWQTAIRLQHDNLLNLRPLISHMMPFEKAPQLFELLDRQPDDIMQAVLDFTNR